MSDFGDYIRKRRLRRQKDSRQFSLRKVAARTDIQPAYLSKIERGDQPPPSEEKIRALAKELDEDPHFLLAMAGKISTSLSEIIRQYPRSFSNLLEQLRERSEATVVRVTRDIKAGIYDLATIHLVDDALVFGFPGVHPQASLTVSFGRTLRVPDDRRDYRLPPTLDRFPLQHVDNFVERLPSSWVSQGGVMLSMCQSEAMRVTFDCGEIPGRGAYPFAIRITMGPINAVTGDCSSPGLGRQPQDYLITPNQPAMDGYCVDEGVMRQFVPTPLGEGDSMNKPPAKGADHLSLQIQVYPMRRAVFERRFPQRPTCEQRPVMRGIIGAAPLGVSAAMRLAPADRMRRQIIKDPFDVEDWDQENSRRCCVHLVNSRQWAQITGQLPPAPPAGHVTARHYAAARVPWLEKYEEPELTIADSGKLAPAVEQAHKAPSASEDSDSNRYSLHKAIRQLRSGDAVREPQR